MKVGLFTWEREGFIFFTDSWDNSFCVEDLSWIQYNVYIVSSKVETFFVKEIGNSGRVKPSRYCHSSSFNNKDFVCYKKIL